jgi:hypothetical protein
MSEIEYVSYNMTLNCENCSRSQYKQKHDFIKYRGYAVGCILCKRYVKFLGYHYEVGETVNISYNRIRLRLTRFK